MARLGLKVFYLRTRKLGLSQQDVADALAIRQATLSQIERGRSLPTCGLLLQLCRFFDVTPTFLLDEDRGLEPLASERWKLRDSLVTVGMWVEAPATSLVETPDGKILCPLQPGESFYDDEAFELRRCDEPARAERAILDLNRRRERTQQESARAIAEELRVHPRRRGRSRR